MSPVVTSRLVQIRAAPIMPSHAGALGHHHAVLPPPYTGAPGPFPPSPFLTEPSSSSLSQALVGSPASSMPVPLRSTSSQTVGNVPALPMALPNAVVGRTTSSNQESDLKSAPTAPRSSCLAQATSIPATGAAAAAAPPPRSGTCASRHMAAEQRRRARINERLEALREIVPHSARANTAAFLTEVYDYISALHRELNRRSEAEAEAGRKNEQGVQDQKETEEFKGQMDSGANSSPGSHVVSPKISSPGQQSPRQGEGAGLDLSLGMCTGSGDSPPSPCKSEGGDENGKVVDGVILACQNGSTRMQGRGAFSAYVSSGKSSEKGSGSSGGPTLQAKGEGGVDGSDSLPADGKARGQKSGDDSTTIGALNHSRGGSKLQPHMMNESGVSSLGEPVSHGSFFHTQQHGSLASPCSSGDPNKPSQGFNTSTSTAAAAAAAAMVAGGNGGSGPSCGHLPASAYQNSFHGVIPPGSLLPGAVAPPLASPHIPSAGAAVSRKRKEVPTSPLPPPLQEEQSSSSPPSPLVPPAASSASTSRVLISQSSAGGPTNYHMMMPMLPPMHPVAMAAAAAAAADAAAAAAVQQWNMAAAVAQAQAQAAVQAHAQAQALVSAVAASSAAAAASAVAGVTPLPASVSLPLSNSVGGIRSSSPPLAQLIPGQPAQGSAMAQASHSASQSLPASIAPQGLTGSTAPPKRRRRGEAKELSNCGQKVVRPIAVRPRP